MRSAPIREAPFSYIFHAVIITAIYFFTAKYGLSFDAVSGFATLVWPPAGIALAALLIYDYRMWPAITVAAFLVNWNIGAPILAALGIALGNTLEAICGAYLIRRFATVSKVFKKLRDTYRFILLAALGSTFIAATVGVIILFLIGNITASSVQHTWLAWWIGDMLGVLIVAPFLLILWDSKNIHFASFSRIAEAIGLILAVGIASWIIFFDLFGIGIGNTALAYLVFLPLLILVTVRFEDRGAVVATILMSVISIGGTVSGRGPFISNDLSHNLIFLQTFMASISITALILSAVLAERRSIITRLARQNTKNQALLESIGEGVIATNVDGDITLCNQAAEVMLQTTRDETIGRRYDSILRLENDDGELIQPLERPLQIALTSGTIFRTAPGGPSYYYLRKDDTRFPIALTVSPIFMNDKIIGVVNVFRDITKELEIDRAKTEFISLASHQFRTPLSTMKWQSETLLTKEMGTLNPAQQTCVEDMHHSNERMIELLNALLTLSKIEMGTYFLSPESLDLTAAADTVLKELGGLITTKRMHVKKHYDPHLSRIHTDRNILTLIFQNLISNSIKYSPHGSEIELKISENKEEFTISVTDRGCGIPANEKNLVFSKFFRAKNARALNTDGSGLGLYIVKSILDRVAGTISFSSKPDHGTTFIVTLPRSS